MSFSGFDFGSLVGRQEAIKTKEAINDAIKRDGGNAYRAGLEKWLPTMSDAYLQQNNKDGRQHLGASVIGGECLRKIWFSYRWFNHNPTGFKDPRLVRLFNTGHLYEAKACAMLETAGIEVVPQDEKGNQFRASFGTSGHSGGACDGLIEGGIPELPTESRILPEFKTASDKSFKRLNDKGVMAWNITYYNQVQIFMGKFDIKYCLHFTINKNDDDIYLEIIEKDDKIHKKMDERADLIISTNEGNSLDRISKDGTDWRCNYCEFKAPCHGNVKPRVNCRTCAYSEPKWGEGGIWYCNKYDEDLKGVEQYEFAQKCESYRMIEKY